MILEAMAVGVFVGINIAASRRYPWIGALWLFLILTVGAMLVTEIVFMKTGERGIFGVLIIAPFAAISETRKALSKQQIAPGHMTYIYGVYGAMVALPLWGIARIVQIVSK